MIAEGNRAAQMTGRASFTDANLCLGMQEKVVLKPWSCG